MMTSRTISPRIYFFKPNISHLRKTDADSHIRKSEVGMDLSKVRSVCASQGAGHYSYESGPCRLHHLGPPQPPSELIVTQRGGRWRCRPCELQATGIKQGHY